MDARNALSITVEKNILDFAQFLASQPNADLLKQDFDKAYHLARYEAKMKTKSQGRWMKISECPRMNG